MRHLVHRTISPWLMPLILFLFFLFPAPANGSDTCVAPRPEDPALDLLIQEARQKKGAAALVPTSVLKAIYNIEAAPYYVYPDQYSCQGNATNTSLGIMQIQDEEYGIITSDSEKMNDAGICQVTDCKLSRCNSADALELAARLLLYKIGLWDDKTNEPLGKITTKDDVYYAAGRYYSSDNFSLDTGLGPRLSPSLVPADGTLTYAEFVCAYSGFCKSLADYPPRTDKPYSGQNSSVKYNFNSCTTDQEQVPSTVFDFHPLRPFPDEVQTTDKLTTFCVMRPLPVGQNRIDMRVDYAGAPVVDIFTVGNLTQDFRKFITPLLSITNPEKPDFTIPFNEKAQRYLLDFLEGRAYYEPLTETTSSDFNLQADLFNRLGVFRKLAPQSYQDKLKRAVIQRAAGSFSTTNNPYGFEPASNQIHNYIVGYWLGGMAYASNHNAGEKVSLKNYINNWAPLPEEYENSPDMTYAQAYTAWKNKDGGKWYSLWPYVPMFTREDTEGIIEIQNSNSPPLDPPEYPGTDFIEVNKTFGTISPSEVEVSHPHLARAYEVSTSLSYLLTPQQVHDNAPVPELDKSWIGARWLDNSPWLDPSYKRPPSKVYGVDLGPLCDVNASVIKTISSSGDFALDDQFTTAVKRVDIGLTHGDINGDESIKGSARPEDKKNCGAEYDCEFCEETGSHYDYRLQREVPDYAKNEVGCFYYKQIRSDPNYLISYTPFLNEILTSLSGGQRGLFDLFKPAGLPQQPYEKFDWPGVGNAGEESPVYDYSPTGYQPPHKKVSEEKGWGEAGFRKPGDSQGYFYRYLGSIQCAKERVLEVLQPFISGSPYEPFAYSCFPEISPPPTTLPKDVTPADEPDQPGGTPIPILTGLAEVCPDGGEEITGQLAARMTDGIIRLLPNSTGPRKKQYRVCIKPTMIIIHWSGGWDNANGNDATYQTLVARDLACQLATDTDDTYLMQPFYEDQVEMPWCARPWNVGSINNEVAGGYLAEDGSIDIRFTDRSGNPHRVGDPARPKVKSFPESEEQINKAVNSICVVMQQYNIPWTQIYGHYQVPRSGKDDPGREFLERVFIPRVKSTCGG